MTDPILDRDASLVLSVEVRSAAAPVLRELVDYGLAVFERCGVTAEGHDTPLGILFPFLHTLEMIDGAEVLLNSAAAVPATLMLRAAFEALLSMLWVAKEDSERRGAAYVVADVHRRIALSERYDPSTQRGKQFEAAVQADDVGHAFKLADSPDAVRDRAELFAVIKQPHLAAAASEYERVRGLKDRVPPFYSLWDGPRDIEQLARRLGKSAYYEVLYRPWSGTAHAVDLARQLTHVDETPAVRRLRSGDGLTEGYSHAIAIALWAIEAALTKYRRDELRAFWTWYLNRVSPTYVRLTGGPNAPPISVP